MVCYVAMLASMFVKFRAVSRHIVWVQYRFVSQLGHAVFCEKAFQSALESFRVQLALEGDAL